MNLVVRMKHCKNCDLTLDGSLFRVRNKKHEGKVIKYLNTICKSCEKVERKSNRSPEYVADYKARKKAEDPVKYHMQERIAQWRRKYDKSDLTVDYLIKLWNSQNGLCFYSGQPMILGGTAETLQHNASLDRVDPELGYTQGNLVWCTYKVNSMKGQLDFDQFIELCSIISKCDSSKPIV